MTNKYKQIVSLLLTLVLIIGMVASPAYAIEKPNREPLYNDNGIKIRLKKQGALDEKTDKADPQRSGGIDGKAHLDSLTINEQSTYADKIPHHFYYRTVGYQMKILDKDMLPLEEGGLIPVDANKVPIFGDLVYIPGKGLEFQRAVVDTKYFKTKGIREQETAAIKDYIGKEGLGKTYVTSWVLSREHLIDALELQGKEYLLDKARYLIRAGVVEYYQADANGKEGPALDSSGTKILYNHLGKKLSSDIKVPPRFEPVRRDIETRMQIIDLFSGEVTIIKLEEKPDLIIDKIEPGATQTKPGTKHSGKIHIRRAADETNEPIDTTIYLTAANGTITSSNDIPINQLKLGEARAVPFDWQAGADKGKGVTIVAEINPEKLGANRLPERTYDNNKKTVTVGMEEEKIDLAVKYENTIDALYKGQSETAQVRVTNSATKPITTDLVWRFNGNQIRKVSITIPAKGSIVDSCKITMPSNVKSRARFSVEIEVNPSRNKPPKEVTWANNKISFNVFNLGVDDQDQREGSDPYLTK